MSGDSWLHDWRDLVKCRSLHGGLGFSQGLKDVKRYFGLSRCCPVSLVCLVPDEIDEIDQRDQTDERRVLVSCEKLCWQVLQWLHSGTPGAHSRRMLNKARLLTCPALATTSPYRPESAKTASSPKDAPYPMQGCSELLLCQGGWDDPNFARLPNSSFHF
jgi:hypothetical protein